MGSRHSLLDGKDLDYYQKLTFLTRQEILNVLARYEKLVSNNPDVRRQSVHDWRLSKKHAARINELHENPFAKRIVQVFSSQPDGSMSFEDFLDMMSVFSVNAPKSVKVAYAFKIYQGIAGARPTTANPVEAIDLNDLQYIVRKLSGGRLKDDETLRIAQDVIKEVDLRDQKMITAEIFEYFLSNVPEFPDSFVIPLSKERRDEHLKSTRSTVRSHAESEG